MDEKTRMNELRRSDEVVTVLQSLGPRYLLVVINEYVYSYIAS